MAIDYDEVSERLFDQLKGLGYTVTMFDDKNNQTLNAPDAKNFYVKELGSIIKVNVNDHAIDIHYSPNADVKEISALKKILRNSVANNYLQIGVNSMLYSGNDIKLKEGFSPATGSMKTSYQATEGARLIIRHNKPVNEEVRGSRSRNIQALFIENAQGERFKYPQNHLLAARTMTKHVAEGGTPYDEVGQKIIGLSEERSQLLQVANYIKTQGLQEQAGDVQFAVTQRLNEIKGLLGRYAPDRLMADVHEADETDLEALQEKLTKNIFDENIGNLLPKLNGYVKEYKLQQEAKEELETLKQQVEESQAIQVSAIPDLDLMSMMVYESPTINTTELINMVLPVLEDEQIKTSLTKLSGYVQEGKLDPAEVENLTRGIIGKSAVAEKQADFHSYEDVVFESVMKKYRLEHILK